MVIGPVGSDQGPSALPVRRSSRRRIGRRRLAMLGAVLALLGMSLLWLFKLVALHAGVDEAREYWSQPRGERGGLVLAALGDSAAQGVGASRPERGWVGLLAQRLRDATGRPVLVVNLSSSGARVQDVLQDQIPELGQVDADVVVVAVGGNDIRAYDAATFEQQVARLTDRLPERTYIADVPYFMHGRWERDAQRAADLVAESARADGLVPVPLHQALRAEGWSAMLTQFAADWFHPNDRGHQVWADAFWDVLKDDPVVRPAD